MADIINYLVDLFTKSLAPRLSELVNKGFLFFALFDKDPVAATQHGAEALIAVAATVLVAWTLYKTIRGFQKTLNFGGAVLGELRSIWVEIYEHIKPVPRRFLLHLIPQLFTASFYKGFVNWAAMLDPITARSMLRGYKDGPIHLRCQRNMGLAVMGLTAWSSLAFGYAVFASGASFSDHHHAIVPAAVVGGLLYGLMILTMDRSIVAPFSPAANSNTPAMSNLPVTAWSWIGWHLPTVLKLATRIAIAALVAGFTALPLTMLVLHGGIAAELAAPAEQLRVQREARLQALLDQRAELMASRQTSQACVVATEAVAQSQKRIDEMAHANCLGGATICPRERTTALEQQHKQYLQAQTERCTVAAGELTALDQEVARLRQQLMQTPAAKGEVDVLQGATVLEKLAREHQNNLYFHPVTATYNLLFAIELIPLLMKLWKAPMVNRRQGGDRRSGDAGGQGPERRAYQRRASDLRVVTGT